MSKKSLANQDSTRRLALGVVFGMLIGIVPKESLFCYLTFVVLMISTANLLSAFVSGFLFSWAGYLLDGFSHKLGGLVLTADPLESTWAWLYQLPVMPWTRFNNTVVMGSVIVGFVLIIPVYLLSHRFFETWGKSIHDRIQNNWLYRWLIAPPVDAVGKAS